MNQLEKTRIKINEIDEQMAKCFEERMKAVEEVIAYKLENNIPVFDSSREKQVIEMNSKKVCHTYRPYYKAYIQSLMDISKQYQHAIINSGTYGYQGSEGAFAQIACSHLFPNGNQKNYATWNEVVQAILNHEIDKGVLPFENSYTGEVGEVLDLLFKNDIKIIKIYDLKINQNLLGIPGTQLSDIRQVISHHQALSQCMDYIKDHHFEIQAYPNTALAAKYVSELQDKTVGAIASIETAQVYGLDVLAENINTKQDNTTRFIVIGNELNETGHHVSIMFTVNHESGQLAKIMEIIARYQYNMVNIRSRSLKQDSWQYYFYIEIEGEYDERMKEMLAECERNSERFKIAGVN